MAIRQWPYTQRALRRLHLQPDDPFSCSQFHCFRSRMRANIIKHDVEYNVMTWKNML